MIQNIWLSQIQNGRFQANERTNLWIWEPSATTKTNGSTLGETFQIACLINKLSDTWLDFAKILSHTQGDPTIIQVLNSI